MRTQQQIEERIAFLHQQLDSLDHYLPDTYQFLMAELDSQQRELMEIKIQSYYHSQDNESKHQNTDS